MLIRDHKPVRDSKARCIHCGQPAEIFIIGFACNEDLTWCRSCVTRLMKWLIDDLCELLLEGPLK